MIKEVRINSDKEINIQSNWSGVKVLWTKLIRIWRKLKNIWREWKNAAVFVFCHGTGLPIILYLRIIRTDDFEKNSEYAKAWKKDDDGGVISDQPRITVGDGAMGPQGGYITR